MQLKPKVALIAGAILLFGSLGQTAKAQSIIAPTTVTLANLNGSGTKNGPDSLNVTYSVTEVPADAPLIYTYTYVVNNPSVDTGVSTTFSIAITGGNPLVGAMSGNGTYE